MLIDTHCHLLSSEYDNVDEVIKENLKVVDKIIINGYDVLSSIEAVKLASKYDNVYAAIGIGPENIESYNKNTINVFKKLLTNKKVVAIGEIGLDYYWTKDNKEEQQKVFKEMLFLASNNKLPVIVHNREATMDIISILKEYSVNGIMHCFSGSLETASEFIKMGFLIGVGGVVTFKNASKLKDVVENIGLNSISLETDSPYLSPEPYRGIKNEPKRILEILEVISKIKGVDKEKIKAETSEAVHDLFDL